MSPKSNQSRQDAETLTTHMPKGGKSELRFWLRMLACTNMIEGEIRSRLREQFSVTLPRFDLMSQLEREPDGLRLSDLSRRMMVTNGNVTGLIDRLERENLVDRRVSEEDRRVTFVALSAAGRAQFAEMAREHEVWVADMFADLSADQMDGLMELLAATKASVQRSMAGNEE